jgi:hypothetical protein
MFEETRPWRTTRTPVWSLISYTRIGHLEAEACHQQRLATSRGLPPTESCHQQRLATSRVLPPAETYDQQRLATSRGLQPAETGESWHRQLINTGLQLSRQPIQYSHLSYQNTSISLLREITSLLNKRTASRAEFCLLAISDQFCKIKYAVTFFHEFS